jgi:hypothetical protein
MELDMVLGVAEKYVNSILSLQKRLLSPSNWTREWESDKTGDWKEFHT